MTQTVRRTLAPVALTAAFTFLSWLLVLSARAGALENRVMVAEQHQMAIADKLERLLDLQRQTREAVVRLETRLDLKGNK